MSEGNVRVDRDGAVATVVLLRAAKANAIDGAMAAALTAAATVLAGDDSLRAVVITGEGERAFCGGADVREMAAIGDPAAGRRFIGGLHAALTAVRAVPVPTIARIGGVCLGAGLELAASCDLRVAAEGARFGMPEVKLGIPSVIQASLLPALIGWGRAREMLLLGETIDAAEALRIGLVERVVPASGLDAAVSAWVASAGAAGPTAVRRQKRLLREWEAMTPDDAAAASIAAFGESWESGEPAAMMRGILAPGR